LSVSDKTSRCVRVKGIHSENVHGCAVKSVKTLTVKAQLAGKQSHALGTSLPGQTTLASTYRLSISCHGYDAIFLRLSAKPMGCNRYG
jgi:hypothetical protein